MRKFGLRAEAAVARIELGNGRSGNLVHQRQGQLAASAGEALVVLDRRHDAGCGFERLVAPFAPHLRHGEQHAPEAGPAIAVVARKVCPAEVGPAVGSEKRGQRPSALPADRRNRRLVARIHIGPLIAIHLHRDIVLVDDARPAPGPRRIRDP